MDSVQAHTGRNRHETPRQRCSLCFLSKEPDRKATKVDPDPQSAVWCGLRPAGPFARAVSPQLSAQCSDPQTSGEIIARRTRLHLGDVHTPRSELLLEAASVREGVQPRKEGAVRTARQRVPAPRVDVFEVGY